MLIQFSSKTVNAAKFNLEMNPADNSLIFSSIQFNIQFNNSLSAAKFISNDEEFLINDDSIQSLDSAQLRNQNSCFYKLFKQINVAKFLKFEAFSRL